MSDEFPILSMGYGHDGMMVYLSFSCMLLDMSFLSCHGVWS